MPENWRKRLEKVIKRDGRKLRAISIAAGLPENALWEVVNTNKEPGIDKMLAICGELKVSLSEIFEGIEISPESARLLKAWGQMSKDERETFLQYVEKRRPR